jgi:hypothetical protein
VLLFVSQALRYPDLSEVFPPLLAMACAVAEEPNGEAKRVAALTLRHALANATPSEAERCRLLLERAADVMSPFVGDSAEACGAILPCLVHIVVGASACGGVEHQRDRALALLADAVVRLEREDTIAMLRVLLPHLRELLELCGPLVTPFCGRVVARLGPIAASANPELTVPALQCLAVLRCSSPDRFPVHYAKAPHLDPAVAAGIAGAKDLLDLLQEDAKAKE